MKTYKNIHFTKRSYEFTNKVFCQTSNKMDSNWKVCEDSELEDSDCDVLYSCNGERYFGYL